MNLFCDGGEGESVGQKPARGGLCSGTLIQSPKAQTAILDARIELPLGEEGVTLRVKALPELNNLGVGQKPGGGERVFLARVREGVEFFLTCGDVWRRVWFVGQNPWGRAIWNQDRPVSPSR